MEDFTLTDSDFEYLQPEDATREEITLAMETINALSPEQKKAIFLYGFAQFKWGQPE